ncbi:MAG: PKD domain-containing protein, partial [Saprospiraceae bacterium]
MSYIQSLKNILILAGLMFFLCTSEKVAATHIVGGNLTYKHISGDIYQVKLVLRRDCFLGSPEAQFDDPASIGIFTSSGALAIWLGNNGQIRMPFMSSDTLNEFINSDCGFEGTQVCVHETVYSGIVSLPNRPGGYTLAYQRCCRNATLNNVSDPLETGATYWINVNEASLLAKNNSPEFIQWPGVYICANKPIVFDHAAVDLDGDSLVYKLCAPSLGATLVNPKPQPPGFPPYSNVLWAPPYNLSNMMGGDPVKIDSKTGILTGTPNLVGQFLIGVCVEEYRNGVLLGIVRRDFQYNVRVCSQPPLADFNTSETNCDGLRVEFFNTSLSSSAYQWNFNYPSTNPVFLSTTKDPIFTYPAPGIYKVLLRATRGSDGCFDTIVRTVFVFQNKITPSFTYQFSDCNTSKDSFSLSLFDGSEYLEPGFKLETWNWKVTQNGATTSYSGINPKAQLSNNGDVTIELNVSADNGCMATKSLLIPINTIQPRLDFKIEYLSCPVNDSIDIRLINLSKPLNPFATLGSSQWLVSGKTYVGDSTIVRIPKSLSQISILLKSSLGQGCDIEQTKIISLQAQPVSSFSHAGSACSGLTISFANTSQGASSYEWQFKYPDIDPQFVSRDTNPAFTFPNPGVYDVLLKATNASSGCIDSSIQKVFVFENTLSADFTFSLSGCEEGKDSLTLQLSDKSTFDQPGFGIFERKWKIVQSGVTKLYTGTNPNIMVGDTGILSIDLEVLTDNGCTKSISKSIPVNALKPSLDFNIEYIGCPANDSTDIRLVNLSAPLNPFATISASQWTLLGKVLNGDSSLIRIPISIKDITLTLQTSFLGGCDVKKSKVITLRPPAESAFSHVGSACSGLTITLTNKSKNASSYEWNLNYPSSDVTFISRDTSPTFTFPQAGVYDVLLKAIREVDGCIDSSIQRLFVFDNKIMADFSFALSGCEAGKDSLQLQLQDLSTYDEPGFSIFLRNWRVKQGDITQKYAGVSPSIMVGDTGTITIELDLLTESGCAKSVSKTITLTSLVPTLDFNIDYINCPVNDSVDIRLINLSSPLNPFATIGSSQWILQGKTLQGDSAVIRIPTSLKDVSITLHSSFLGGCDVSKSKLIALRAPTISAFTHAGSACSGLTVAFANTSTNAASYEWNFNYPDADPAFVSSDISPNFRFPQEGVYDVLLKAIRGIDGCIDSSIQKVFVFENKVSADFSYQLSDCNPALDSLSLKLSDISKTNEPGFNISSTKWTVVQNGVTRTFTGPNPSIGLSGISDAVVTLEVLSENGCAATITKNIKTAEVVPVLDFMVTLDGCFSDSLVTLKLKDISAALNPFGIITSSTWKIKDQQYTGDSIILEVPNESQLITVQLQNVFSGACLVEISKTIDISQIVPKAAYSITPVECPTDDQVKIKL